MGQRLSKNVYHEEPVNYNCPVCKKTNKLPNILGRFFIVNDKECICNGCNTIFPKSKYYKKPYY